jgi:hypothetical protein
MRNLTRKAGFITAMTGVAVLLSGCDLEVLNPGAIQDADLSTPELMPILVNGVSAEYNDIADNYAFDGGILTDELAGTGSYTSTQENRQGIFDWEHSQSHWEQTHEAAWAAGEAWERLQEVLPNANADADASKLFMLMGFAHQRLGENFCQVVYDVGDWQDRSASFDSARVAFQQAITIGGAAGAGANDYVMAARAGVAQSYAAQGNWAMAATAANAVPTSYVNYALYNPQANQNIVWQESYGRAEVGVYRTLAKDLHDAGDPRTPYTKCGEWNDLATAYPGNISSGVTTTGACSGQGSGAHQGADGTHAHYRPDKYADRGGDIPRASGAEMRLIEAEAFMNAGNFPAFNAKITELRAFYGLGPHIHQATALGALEFPHIDPTNAADTRWDAMSVLDQERYATLWITGRRLYDLDRWNHPFLNGNWIVGSAALASRAACMPIPRVECQLNPNLADDANGVCAG